MSEDAELSVTLVKGKNHLLSGYTINPSPPGPSNARLVIVYLFTYIYLPHIHPSTHILAYAYFLANYQTLQSYYRTYMRNDLVFEYGGCQLKLLKVVMFMQNLAHIVMISFTFSNYLSR